MQIHHKNKKSKNSILRTVSEINFDIESLRPEERYIVQEIRDLTDTSYVVRFDKKSIDFQAGQHITLGIPGDNQAREYSIYSPANKPYLEVLIKEVEDGLVSKKLHRVKAGDPVKADGPFGFFTLNKDLIKDQKYLFIATGTGIAPFHSIAGSYPGLDYQIIHGVRTIDEAYESDFYPADRYTVCTSRDNKGDFSGRVTDYLLTHKIDSGTLVYLCGNCDMIYEAYDLLTSRGVDADQIKTEVYF